MSSVYHFLPWLREGLASRLRSPKATEDAHRGRLDLAATFNDAPLDLPSVSVLGPGDILGLDPAQIVRTEPTAGATGFEPSSYPCVDLDSPTLPWLFTPQAAEGERLQPWLCLVVVRQQDGVTLTANAERATTELSIARPSDAAVMLPDLTQAWAWAHVQVSGGLDEGQSLGEVIARFPERVVSRLICPTPLAPGSRYYACLVPTFAVGRDAALGRPPAPGLAPAWTATDHEITLPVYYHWEFATGSGADFASLVGALRFRQAPAGLGQRPMELDGSGLVLPPDAAPLPPLVGALCAQNIAYEPSPDWVKHALAPLIGSLDSGSALPLYAGEQAGARHVTAEDTGWLGELNLDPRHRAIAALGAAVVRDRQEDLAAAAWAQAGQIAAANALAETGRISVSVGSSLLARNLAGVATTRTLAQLLAPLQRAESADVTTTTAMRRITRPRGPVARRAAPAAAMAAPGIETAAAADDRAALLALVDPARTARRVTDRIAFAGSSGEVPLTATAVAPSYPTPMAGDLARLAPQFLLPGADQIPADTVVALQTNPRFVAAFLAGINTELAAELRWREFPLDGTATYVQQFWDRRGQGGGTPTPDIEPIARWNPASGLAQVVTGSSAGAQVVLAVRGQLLRRFPRTAVYAIRSTNATTVADETNPANVSYPIFSGWIDPDIRYFGFSLTVAEATASPGWFFAFSEQPTETRFGPPLDGSVLPGAEPSSAAVAQRALRLPIRVIVHASTLLTPHAAAQGVSA